MKTILLGMMLFLFFISTGLQFIEARQAKRTADNWQLLAKQTKAVADQWEANSNKWELVAKQWQSASGKFENAYRICSGERVARGDK